MTEDHTQRIRALEVSQGYTDKQLSGLDAKVDRLSTAVEKLNNQLPMFVEGLTAVASEFRSFKGELMGKQLANLEVEHKAEIAAIKEQSETGFKVKLLWAGLGVIATAVVLSLVRIFMTRFGG